MRKIVLNIPHANPVFPSEQERLKWEDQDLLVTLINTWTDWFTDKIFMPNEENKSSVESIIFPYSRFYIDVERLVEDELNKIGQGIVYTSISGNVRKVEDTSVYMALYHEHIGRFSSRLDEDTILIDCHSFPSAWADVDVCIGYNNDESYSKELVDLVINYFESCGYKVSINTPYSNSITPVHPITYKSFMIELNKRIYMNEENISLSENAEVIHSQINNLYKILKEYENTNDTRRIQERERREIEEDNGLIEGATNIIRGNDSQIGNLSQDERNDEK